MPDTRLGISSLSCLARKLGPEVAAEAAHVRVRLADLDGLLVGAGDVVVDVPHSLELGADGAEHAVIAVAGVALVGLDVAVLVVGRRERVAFRVPQVRDVALHDVAGAAGFHAHGFFHAVRRGEEHHHHGQHQNRTEEHRLRGSGDAPRTGGAPDPDEEREVEDGDHEADAAQPLARRSDPAMRLRDAEVLRIRQERRRAREQQRGGRQPEPHFYFLSPG